MKVVSLFGENLFNCLQDKTQSSSLLNDATILCLQQTNIAPDQDDTNGLLLDFPWVFWSSPPKELRTNNFGVSIHLSQKPLWIQYDLANTPLIFSGHSIIITLKLFTLININWPQLPPNIATPFLIELNRFIDIQKDNGQEVILTSNKAPSTIAQIHLDSHFPQSSPASLFTTHGIAQNLKNIVELRKNSLSSIDGFYFNIFK